MNYTGKSMNFDLLRNFWETLQNPCKIDANMEERLLAFAAKGILPAIALFLACVIALVSYLLYERSKEGMKQVLIENGTTLIDFFQKMLDPEEEDDSKIYLRKILTSMSSGPSIEFIAVVMPDGTIVAHSGEDRVGEGLTIDGQTLNREEMKKLAPADKDKSLSANVDGHDVFLIYRHFDLKYKNDEDTLPHLTILLGVNASPFEREDSQNRSFVTMLAIVTMLVVLCGLLALRFAQRSLDYGKKQKHAEGEVHRLEEEIRRKEKLAAVGTLAAGVAHELRNPLSSIKGYAGYFCERFPEGSEDRRAADVMVKEVDRLNRVITDLLGLSRPDDVKLKPVRLDYLIEYVKRLVRHQASKNHVQVICKMARKIPLVDGDLERLNQAVLNMCLNGIEAMPDGGALLIALSGGKNRVCLIIQDTGMGISPENLNRIFDPYFTTKGSGTGLGLPIVHKIISAHNGNIRVTSRLQNETASGRTTFRIWFPAASAQ